MINKEEMMNELDKRIDTLKQEFSDYLDSKIEDDKKDEEFYEETSNDNIRAHRDLYLIDPEKVKVGDIVFGVVSNEFTKEVRYPFRVVYNSRHKLMLLGTKHINQCLLYSSKYSSSDDDEDVYATTVRWKVKLFVKAPEEAERLSFANDEIIFDRRNVQIPSYDEIKTDDIDLTQYMDEYNMALGFEYWIRKPESDPRKNNEAMYYSISESGDITEHNYYICYHFSVVPFVNLVI